MAYKEPNVVYLDDILYGKKGSFDPTNTKNHFVESSKESKKKKKKKSDDAFNLDKVTDDIIKKHKKNRKKEKAEETKRQQTINIEGKDVLILEI